MQIQCNSSHAYAQLLPLYILSYKITA